MPRRDQLRRFFRRSGSAHRPVSRTRDAAGNTDAQPFPPDAEAVVAAPIAVVSASVTLPELSGTASVTVTESVSMTGSVAVSLSAVVVSSSVTNSARRALAHALARDCVRYSIFRAASQAAYSWTDVSPPVALYASIASVSAVVSQIGVPYAEMLPNWSI